MVSDPQNKDESWNDLLDSMEETCWSDEAAQIMSSPDPGDETDPLAEANSLAAIAEVQLRAEVSTDKKLKTLAYLRDNIGEAARSPYLHNVLHKVESSDPDEQIRVEAAKLMKSMDSLPPILDFAAFWEGMSTDLTVYAKKNVKRSPKKMVAAGMTSMQEPLIFLDGEVECYIDLDGDEYVFEIFCWKEELFGTKLTVQLDDMKQDIVLAVDEHDPTSQSARASFALIDVGENPWPIRVTPPR